MEDTEQPAGTDTGATDFPAVEPLRATDDNPNVLPEGHDVPAGEPQDIDALAEGGGASPAPIPGAEGP